MSREGCPVSPHPDLPASVREEIAARGETAPRVSPHRTMAADAARRGPMRGNLSVLVVMAEFRDRRFTRTRGEIEDLFFSTGVIPTGSVHEYYREVSSAAIGITGKVVGPFEMPRRLAEYAGANSGRQATSPNVQTLGRDAALAAAPDVNFSSFDNDSNGFVDALVVVHAGRGAEMTGRADDLWSIRQQIEGGEMMANQTSILRFLTIAEDSPMGVPAHELGHLLFGWPDLYRVEAPGSEGAGNWCLMGHGTWNGREAGAEPGQLPAHPSAWCKATQGWVTPKEQKKNEVVPLESSGAPIRLWTDARLGPEYFLIENRQRSGFDRALPGDGLLIWHIDESRLDNEDVDHPRVALMQADGNRDLEQSRNSGDAADAFARAGMTFDGTSNPSSKAYDGSATAVAVTTRSDSAPTMELDVRVTNAEPPAAHGRGRAVGR